MLRIHPHDAFAHRHIGPDANELDAMLHTIGATSLDELIDGTVPDSIRLRDDLELPSAMTEQEYLEHITAIGAENKVFKSFIGLGYYDTVTPSVILRNVFENPGWYTQYTPYQAEIAQGRLEALLNFQTMVSDLTAMPVANASLLDEATAAAEAMAMFFHQRNKNTAAPEAPRFWVSDTVFPQTIDVLQARAAPLGIEVVIGDTKTFTADAACFGVMLQYPDKFGEVSDYRALVESVHAVGGFVTVAADIMSLALLTPPGEWGADVVVGNTQRFGVPMGYGGPHAAYFATRETLSASYPVVLSE